MALTVRMDIPPPTSRDPLAFRMQEVRVTMPTVPVGGSFDVLPVEGVTLARLQSGTAAVVYRFCLQHPGRRFTTSAKGLDCVRVWRTA